MMRFFYFVLSLTIVISTHAQTYEVTKVEFIDDPDLANYFEGKGMIQWKGIMRDEFEQQTKSQLFKIQPKQDTLLVTPAASKSGRVRKIPKVRDGQYELTNSRMFMRFEFTGKDTVMIQGRYKSLGEPEDQQTEVYQNLKKKYGEKAETFVTKSYLKRVNQEALDNALDIEKAFRVTDVEFSVNEDVMAFGKAQRPHFMGISKNYEDQVRDNYMGRQFKVKINHNTINISSYKMENSSFSYSSNIDQREDGLYRAKVMKTFWDFHTNAHSQEEFDLEKLEYIQFIELRDEDKDAPQYQKLKAKYGDKLPYNIIVQQVEAIPIE